MPLPTPRLDDRAFADLVAEARARIPLYAPEWTDHNMSDPGITLIELFAYMVDIVLYRLNRVPDKHFVKFMDLIGMRLHEAEPARSDITFWLSAPQPNSLTIPGNTEVGTLRTEMERSIVFSTDGALEIKVPALAHVMTSVGGEDRRGFRLHSAESILEGYEGFEAFVSTPPANDDALYFGFENDISQHIIGIELQVDTAGGAGIDPNHPPYVWEVLGAGLNQGWTAVEIDSDSTLGLNVSGQVRLHVPEMRRATRNDISAFWIRCRLASIDANNRYNVSPRIARVGVTSWGGTTSATNVTIVRNEVIGRSDGSPGQTFYLTNVPALARTSGEHLLVRREDGYEERWQEVSDFAASRANDRHYMLESETGEVRLGPALPQRDGQVMRYGALAPKNALLIMREYRFGGGVQGNVGARALNELRTSLPYIARVTNRQPARGGKDAENLENAKVRVPGHLRSLNRAVTASDYVYLTQESAPGEVGRSHCLFPPLTSPGEVIVLVIPQIPVLRGFIAPESLELTTELSDKVSSYLDERRLLSTRLTVSPPDYQWVETEIRIRPAEGFAPEKVRQAVESRLFEFINPLGGGHDGTGWPFGRDLLVSDVMAVLLSIPGVNFVRSVRLIPVTYDQRQFSRGAETQEILLPPQGVVVSYQHNVIME
jgi:predicted phage baseplate assembly protein